MKILEYNDLNTSDLQGKYKNVELRRRILDIFRVQLIAKEF